MRKALTLIIFLAFILLCGYACWYSIGSEGGADSWNHYQISRFSWKHPELLLDHWGKPAFLLFSSPFTQLGYTGAKFFNLGIAVLTGLVLLYGLRKLAIPMPWFITGLVLFAPIYFIVIPGSLTEPLFALLILSSIVLTLDEKWWQAALVASILPYSRTEGIFILPIFMAWFALIGRWKELPLFLTAFIIYSIAGYFVLDDFWWFFHRNPYPAVSPYGHGPFNHFISQYHKMLGWPLAILVLLGLGWLLYSVGDALLKDNFKKVLREKQTAVLFLAGGIFISFFAAHTIFWWKGIHGSLGLLRVIASVVPAGGLLAAYGFNWLHDLVMKEKILIWILLPVTALSIYLPFSTYQIPIPPGEEDKYILQACDYIKAHDLTREKIYYLHPIIPMELGQDPFNREKMEELWNFAGQLQEGKVPVGTVVFWDGHFGPNECKLPKEDLLNNPDFKVLLHVVPDPPFKTLNDYDYEVYLFQRIK